MKKLMCFIVTSCLIFTLVACTEEISTLGTTSGSTTTTTTGAIEINVDSNSVLMIEKETYQLVVTSTDPIGLIYGVDQAGIINLSDTGFITAVNEGIVIITIGSRSNPNVFEEITVVVRKEIMLVSNHLTVNMMEDDTHQLVITSNDDYVFTVTNSDILTVDNQGFITAKTEGVTTIIVTSSYDSEVSIIITVNVAKRININVNKASYILVVGDSETIDVTSNDGLSYLSGDNGVVTVSQIGEVTAIGFGETTVRITSTYDVEVSEEITIIVYKYTEEISINGDETLIKGMDSQLLISTVPVGAYSEVTWESSDETVLTINEFGVVSAIAAGNATIVAKSVIDETIVDTFNITVLNILIVDSTKNSGDTYLHENLELSFGEQLFNTLGAALDIASPNTIIYVESGTYIEDVSIVTDGLSIIGLSEDGLGEPIIFKGLIDIKASNIEITFMQFEANARITNSVPIENFVFIQNTVQNITQTTSAFLLLNDANNVQVSYNVFQGLVGGAIEIFDFHGELIEIEGNIIDNCTTAITLDAVSTLDAITEVKVFWNEISNIDLAFSIDMLVGIEEQNIFKVARFNKISNYINAVSVNPGSEFDFTLNYWGLELLDYTKFINVDSYYLKGTYVEPLLIPTKITYNSTLPITISITNPIDEILIGETHTFEYEILPYELSDAPVRFITGYPDLVAINQSGAITPLSSGDVYIQIRSASVSTIRTQWDFSIITTPGLELTTTNIYNSVVVGDEFTLETILFPYTIENETATIESSAPGVASIDASGLVTTHAEGLVTFTATLDSDVNVLVNLTMYVHGLLDPENNLLDFLTTQQISYSTIHHWRAYGFQYDYFDTRAESVSRYYFGDIPIETSKIVPVSTGIRPGEPMEPHPEGVTQYNPYNVYWIVVHDTASTALGSNALAHANYLSNSAANGIVLNTSWHFSIDDHDVYQHLPEIERGYHAGDGSTLPTLNSPYLGGGNRNGIGIEMCINEDGDLYRTWQRTAKLVSYLLEKYNLPLENQTYHNDFSGKDCPRTLRNAGLIPLFEEFLAAEYYIKTNYPNATITLVSNNPDYLDNTGRIIQIPARAITVSYTITVTDGGNTESRTFYTYIPGTVR